MSLINITDDYRSDILNDYLCNNEITVKQIIEKYNINITPNKLKQILPLIETDTTCIHCSSPMKRKVLNRHELSKPFCPLCGHISFYPDSFLLCSCHKCNELKKAQIRTYYENRYCCIALDSISTKIKIPFIKILRFSNELKTIDGKFIDNISNAERLSLMNEGILSISPFSPIDAFKMNDDFPSFYYIYGVKYDVNVAFSDDEKKAIVEGSYLANSISKEEKLEIVREYMHLDVMSQFSFLMHERGFNLKILPNAESNFKSLYSEISYSEIITLCFRVARYCLDMVRTNKFNRRLAEQGAITMAINFYNNSKIKNWMITKSEVGNCGEDLKWCIKNILNKDLNILNNIITLDSL